MRQGLARGLRRPQYGSTRSAGRTSRTARTQRRRGGLPATLPTSLPPSIRRTTAARFEPVTRSLRVPSGSASPLITRAVTHDMRRLAVACERVGPSGYPHQNAAVAVQLRPSAVKARRFRPSDIFTASAMRSNAAGRQPDFGADGHVSWFPAFSLWPRFFFRFAIALLHRGVEVVHASGDVQWYAPGQQDRRVPGHSTATSKALTPRAAFPCVDETRNCASLMALPNLYRAAKRCLCGFFTRPRTPRFRS